MRRTAPAVLIVLLWPLTPAPAAAPKEKLPKSVTGKVVAVADGDTLTVLVGKTQHKIRLHGIDTPEKAQPFGKRDRQFTSGAVFGKPVVVQVTDKDRWGRLASGSCELSGVVTIRSAQPKESMPASGTV